MLLFLSISTHMSFHLVRSRAWMFKQGNEGLKYLAERFKRTVFCPSNFVFGEGLIFKFNIILLVPLFLTHASPG